MRFVPVLLCSIIAVSLGVFVFAAPQVAAAGNCTSGGRFVAVNPCPPGFVADLLTYLGATGVYMLTAMAAIRRSHATATFTLATMAVAAVVLVAIVVAARIDVSLGLISSFVLLAAPLLIFFTRPRRPGRDTSTFGSNTIRITIRRGPPRH